MKNQERTFSDADARDAWNVGARAWNEFVESGADYYRHAVHGPALIAMCEPVAGLDVLDLGCGQGYFSRELAKRGARVVGIDLAEEQLAFARMYEEREPLGIEYRVMGATEVATHWPEGHFALITVCMALQDMADPGAVLQCAFTMLRDGGRMAFSVPHPCTDTPVREWVLDESGKETVLKIGRYFESGPAVCHWRMRRLEYHWDTPYWRRTLSEWSELTTTAGFLIRRIGEPRPAETQVESNPHIRDSYEIPTFLLFELIKL